MTGRIYHLLVRNIPVKVIGPVKVVVNISFYLQISYSTFRFAKLVPVNKHMRFHFVNGCCGSI